MFTYRDSVSSPVETPRLLLSSLRTKRTMASFCTGRLRNEGGLVLRPLSSWVGSPIASLIFRVYPSVLGYGFSTRASCHLFFLFCTHSLSLIRTMLSVSRLQRGRTHFWCSCKDCTNSLCQRISKLHLKDVALCAIFFSSRDQHVETLQVLVKQLAI